MSQYKCIRSFDSNLKRYYYGEKITSGQYLSLDSSYRSNFSLEDDEPSYSSSSSSSDSYSSPSYDSGSSFDFGSSSSDSSSSTDFGGGDFGGGGASGDW